MDQIRCRHLLRQPSASHPEVTALFIETSSICTVGPKVEAIGQARRIDLLNAERGKYFRIVATVLADVKDIGQTLIDHVIAVKYDGGKKTKEWCID